MYVLSLRLFFFFFFYAVTSPPKQAEAEDLVGVTWRILDTEVVTFTYSACFDTPQGHSIACSSGGAGHSGPMW